jgi:hypothetical protein
MYGKSVTALKRSATCTVKWLLLLGALHADCYYFDIREGLLEPQTFRDHRHVAQEFSALLAPNGLSFAHFPSPEVSALNANKLFTLETRL